jgi:hypothetical protein
LIAHDSSKVNISLKFEQKEAHQLSRIGNPAQTNDDARDAPPTRKDTSTATFRQKSCQATQNAQTVNPIPFQYTTIASDTYTGQFPTIPKSQWRLQEPYSAF